MRLEQQLGELADDRFSPTYLRNATAYGVSPRLRVDLVLNNLVGYAVTTGRIHLLSDGTPWRPIVHIEDISRAFLAVLDAPRELVHDQAFNVGRTAENYRIRELAEIVAETVPGCAITYADDAGPDKRCYRVDCGKIERVLPAFQPRWDARQGARELYDAYREAGLTAEQFLGARFIRLKRIQELQGEGRLDGALRWRAPVTVVDGSSTRTTQVPLRLVIAVSSSSRQLSRSRWTMTSARRERKVETTKTPPGSRNAS